MRDYHPLSAQRLSGTVSISQPAAPSKVTLESPASEVMTDLNKVNAACIKPHTTMEAANNYMVQRGVRLLLVLNPGGSLAGLITSTDILGDKPLRFIQDRQVKHSEILVSDVMTPLDRLEALPLDEVARANVGHIIASLRDTGRQHTLVTSQDAQGQTIVCGIFSRSQIEKQVGAPIEVSEVAKTFAEIEATLVAD
ncbi:MAG TPA: CBS domain-containing protein [Usitatibacteraceae bacterium]